MTIKTTYTDQVKELLTKAAGLDNNDGSPRVKTIVHRLLTDMFQTIEDLNITPEEFWQGVYYLNDLGTNIPEAALLAPGLGFDHYLDIRMDAADAEAGLDGGTPRTIEGPLYVAGAPKSDGFARMVDGTEDGGTLLLTGQVVDKTGNPIVNAKLELWHANLNGTYSYFDPSQSEYNLRRTIMTDAEGRYAMRSIIPSGYSVPPGGSTDIVLKQLGRHGNRPAHIHFFVSADGFTHLTTQINIAGDKYTYDDFAFGTREELVVPANSTSDVAEEQKYDLPEKYKKMVFDITLVATKDENAKVRHARARALEE